MKSMIHFAIGSFFILSVLSSCATQKKESVKKDDFNIQFQKYKLKNGLNVVLHKDASDPIVAVAILYHVGSSHEKPGKTGFAHLFEHMLFQASENVPQDQFFKKIQNVGGTLNGNTWYDRTMYFEVVPSNALETALWLESDRMGFLLNTVTEAAFANQQEVVLNEKRQHVDNRPYGHTGYVIGKNIYPKGHPYSWQVIGEMADLQNATVEDVKAFYKQFYGPNNATLVVAGDYDEATAKQWIEKYFGEIKKGQEVAPLGVQNVTLDQSIRRYHEDNFATAPQLNMVWPTVEQYNKDAYALDFLAKILADGKKAPMYKVLVKEKKLTSGVYARNAAFELSGTFRIAITASQGVDLDAVGAAVYESFRLFEQEGIKDSDMERIKAGIETDFYNGISSVLNKAVQIAEYNTYAGDPAFISQDIAHIKAVNKEDVMRVYRKYIKDKPFVLTSFVPKGQLELGAAQCEKAQIVEEVVTKDTATVVADEEVEIIKTPSAFDRSIEPATGPAPQLHIPQQWNSELSNGLAVYGIQQNELPLVKASLVLRGGHLLDQMNKQGVANLMSDIMQEGTAQRTPEELEEAINQLGASIRAYTSVDEIVFQVNSLARNFAATMALLEEMILQPRWDEDELAVIKTRTINQIDRRSGDPNAVTRKVYQRLLYGTDNLRGYTTAGSAADVEAITMEDLKTYYDSHFSPSVSAFHVVGDITQEEALSALSGLAKNWKAKEVTIPPSEAVNPADKVNRLYFVDFPDAKQSVIRIGCLSLKRTDKDYYPADVMNYKLGGSFSGLLNLILREEKGYTYGARSYFSGLKHAGTFTASSSVRSNATLESVKIFREEMEKYREGISQADLGFTKNAMTLSNARKFETLDALIGLLQARSKYGFAPDYIKQEEEIIQNMTLAQHKALAERYIQPNQMVYVVTGDAKTQLEPLKNVGFDEVVLLDKEGNTVQ